MADGLREARDTLHALAVRLLEMAERAQLAGAVTLAIELPNFVGMARACLKAVMAMEIVLGSSQSPTLPVNPTPMSDTQTQLDQLMAQIQAQSDELRWKAFENLKKSFEQQNKVPEPAPQPPVQG